MFTKPKLTSPLLLRRFSFRVPEADWHLGKALAAFFRESDGVLVVRAWRALYGTLKPEERRAVDAIAKRKEGQS
jgi:hypothetical protein